MINLKILGCGFYLGGAALISGDERMRGEKREERRSVCLPAFADVSAIQW